MIRLSPKRNDHEQTVSLAEVISVDLEAARVGRQVRSNQVNHDSRIPRPVQSIATKNPTSTNPGRESKANLVTVLIWSESCQKATINIEMPIPLHPRM